LDNAVNSDDLSISIEHHTGGSSSLPRFERSSIGAAGADAGLHRGAAARAASLVGGLGGVSVHPAVDGAGAKPDREELRSRRRCFLVAGAAGLLSDDSNAAKLEAVVEIAHVQLIG